MTSESTNKGSEEYVDSFVVHYDEIGIKGENRDYFEKLLVGNIKKKLNDFSISINREYGQIMLNLKNSNDNGKQISIICDILLISLSSLSILSLFRMILFFISSISCLNYFCFRHYFCIYCFIFNNILS